MNVEEVDAVEIVKLFVSNGIQVREDRGEERRRARRDGGGVKGQEMGDTGTGAGEWREKRGRGRGEGGPGRVCSSDVLCMCMCVCACVRVLH